MSIDKYIEVNKKLWDWKTGIHVKSRFYNVEAFKKGKSSLNSLEIEALGEVKDKSILHLQCHFGMDSLSLAKMGAKVTGIDFSEKAVETARSLNHELGLDAEFICSNLYDLKNVLHKKFDIVFTSFGVVCWMPDLFKWAQIISHFLNDHGLFYMIEYHPVVCMFDEYFEKIKYPYFNFGPTIEEQRGTYTDGGGDTTHLVYEWSHSLAEVVSSLIKNDLKIVSFEEYPFSVDDVFKKMVKRGHGYWEIEGLEDKIPLMFSIKAVKDVGELK